MTGPVLVDTGPLVALRNEDDAWHEASVKALLQLPRPLLTCWPVLTEAAYLLRGFPTQVRELLASADGSFLRVLPIRSPDIAEINAILERYQDQGFQLADAALMHLAERENADAVFTHDVRDFGVFRKRDGSALNLVPSARRAA